MQISAAPPPAAARRYWMIIAAALVGLVVVAVVGPRVRSRETKRRIAARAAEALDCPADNVQVSLREPITAWGCGRAMQFLQVCPEIERLECLERIKVVKP